MKPTFNRDSSAWFSTIFRSSQGCIEVGRNSHINDQTRISNSQGSTMHIGANVYIGSQCCLRDCDIGDGCYIGENCIIYPGTIIPPGSFISSNSMIVSQTISPANSFIQGPPASSTGYVIEEMCKEYQQSLVKMQKEVRLFRNHQPQAEQAYFLLQFSIPSQHSESVLNALFQAGAGELPNCSNYYQTFGHKLEYHGKINNSRAVRHELLHAVACSSHKLQPIIEVLCQSGKPAPIYQILPRYGQNP